MPERRLVIGRQQVHHRVGELGKLITADYAGKNLVVVGVLKGAFIFLADLVRVIDIPHRIDFVRVASYGNSTASSGAIRLAKDVETDLRNSHVLLVEDIVDSGITIAWLMEKFMEKQADSVRICALINKMERRERPVDIDYVGFTLESGFLVGYGLDYAEQYRSLPAIYTLEF
jgi:hypoxanthine phosphoribosyltransferase